MPDYKSHSIHGELILPIIDKQIEIKEDDLKLYCMGPDAILVTDYNIFDYQHANKTKEYFEYLLKLIKENKLQDNSEVMAFLYGQLDHFVLDIIMHPFIYYMTENIETKHKIKPHGLVEHWIDDYLLKKYGKNQVFYYRKCFINNNQLVKIINKLYNKVYKVNNESIKYNFGMFVITIYDVLARRDNVGLISLIIKLINIGDITYKNDIERVLPYLNLDKQSWYNPETSEEYHESFDELWDKPIDIALETINDVNKYLYQDRCLSNPLILNNISYNTGLSCEKGQKLQYVKRYK